MHFFIFYFFGQDMENMALKNDQFLVIFQQK